MIKKKVLVHNANGLHARPANSFVKTAQQYPCRVTFIKDGRSFNGKSIVSVLSACVKSGSEIELVCEGEAENEAIAAIAAEVESGLGE